LTISGTGLPGGSSIAGALRSLGTNAWGGKVTLGTNATIFGGSGTSLTLDVASGDAVDLSSHTLTVDGAGASGINDAIVGTGGIFKAGSGTLTLAASNSYTGATAVTLGVLNLNSASGFALGSTSSVSVTNATLLVSQSNQVSDSAAVTLSGGTISRASGVSETFAALNLAAASTLDYVGGTLGTLQFGDYEGDGTPAFKLTVNNFFGGNVLKFGSDLSSYIDASYSGTAFTSTYFDINSISGGFTSDWNVTNPGFFTITAIPEPSTVLAAIGLTGLMLWPSRRRLLHHAKALFGLPGTAP